MIILGIETSCDETAAAIIANGTKILAQAIASSEELHQKTGGIIPEVAAREQLRCMMPVIEEVVREPKNKIDALAVAVGPGLIGSLLVGAETAKTLAYAWRKPIVPINHLQAHLYANWLILKTKAPQFPALGLVVSGGHTDLVLMKDHGQLKWLGGTRDDAAGECFDKTARVLGLGYPGGPAISKLATKGNPRAYPLPRPMIKQENFDFSFSGLKTAVINFIRKQKKFKRADLAASIQQAIVDVLVTKTIRAAKKYQVKSVLLAGGVAANGLLREQLADQLGRKFKFFIPPIKLCTDNAAYISSCAHFNYHPVPWSQLQVDPGLRIC